VAANRVQEMSSGGERNAKPTARFVPGDDRKSPTTAQFVPGDDRKSPTTDWTVLNPSEWKHLEEYYALFFDKELRDKLEFSKRVHTIAEMVPIMNTEWYERQCEKIADAALESGTPMNKPPPVPNHPTVEFSLLYDAIRSQLKKVAVPELDEALGIHGAERRVDEYLLGIMKCVQIIDGNEKKAASAKSEKTKPRTKRCAEGCIVPGCSTAVHTLFFEEGHSYKHGDKSKKTCKSINCANIASRNGGVCRSCWKKRMKEARMAVVTCALSVLPDPLPGTKGGVNIVWG